MTEEVFEPELEPAEAAAIFGDRIEMARGYAKALIRDGDLLGLLGPRELPRLWTRHILNSAVVSELVPAGLTVADIGSGAGLPGIPMAIAQPKAHFTLIRSLNSCAHHAANLLAPAVAIAFAVLVGVLGSKRPFFSGGCRRCSHSRW